MKIQDLLRHIADLYDERDMEHGTTDGKRDCIGTASAIVQLKLQGHACRRCLANEKLDAIDKLLQP